MDDHCFSYITKLKKKPRSVFIFFLDKKTDPIFTKKHDHVFSSIFWKSKWQAFEGRFKIYWEQFWKKIWKFSQDNYNLVVLDFSSRNKVVLFFQKQNFLSFIWWIFVKRSHKFFYKLFLFFKKLSARCRNSPQKVKEKHSIIE
jgi:hypothetical protein